MSEQVERRLVDILGRPTESPYGNPIPGLEELGLEPAAAFLDGVENVVEVLDAEGGPVTGVVRRLAEPMQFDPELLGQLKESGILPGASATFSRNGGYIRVDVDGADGGLELPADIASHLFIAR